MKVFDLKTLDVIASVEVGTKPDAIVYEPQTRQVFVFNGHSSNASVIDAATSKVVATIALGGTPEFARADGAGLVYANIESTNELVALDAKGRKVTAPGRFRAAKGRPVLRSIPRTIEVFRPARTRGCRFLI